MGEIVNLTRARKQAARKAARSSADANAAKHGQSLAERRLVQARIDKTNRDLDGHKRTPDADPDA
jgi:hypothetical protein